MNSLPKIGTTIRVEVKNFSAMLLNPIFKDQPTSKFFEGMVVENEKGDDPNSFCLTNNSELFPVRNIMLKNVIGIDGLASEYKRQTKIKTVLVAGSKGNVYTVIVNGEKATCSCPQYQFRKQVCKHIKQVLEM